MCPSCKGSYRLFDGINLSNHGGSEALKEDMGSLDLTPDFAYRGVHDHDGTTRTKRI